MFNSSSNCYSLSDIAAATGCNGRNNDNGMWGDGAW